MTERLDAKPAPGDSLRIVEGVAGLWHYHLGNTDHRALCGAHTMGTSIRLADWRVPFGEHFPKRPTWCEKCETLRGNR